MYYYILRQSKDILNPRVGALLRDGKKQQQQFEMLRSRVGYRKAVELVKLKARDKVSSFNIGVVTSPSRHRCSNTDNLCLVLSTL
jgi:hypothetical protein